MISYAPVTCFEVAVKTKTWTKLLGLFAQVANFISALIREKESNGTKNSLVCNNKICGMIEDTSVLCYQALCFNWLVVRRKAQLTVSIKSLQDQIPAVLKHFLPPLGMASQRVTSDLHLISCSPSVSQVTSFVFARVWPPQFFIWTGCK